VGAGSFVGWSSFGNACFSNRIKAALNSPSFSVDRRFGCVLFVVFSLCSVAVRGQELVDIGDFGGGYSDATDINNSGQVVGNATASDGDDFAFLYSGGTLTDLGTLGTYTYPSSPGELDPGGTTDSSQASGINDSGEIIGTTSSATADQEGFSYSNGVISPLPQTVGQASGINAQGVIVGETNNYSAISYSNGVTTDLGAGAYSFATGINNSGQIVGTAAAGGSNSYAFLYSNGNLTNLGALLGASASSARGINSSGAIIGDYGYVAFIYQNGQMTTLNTLNGVANEYNTSRVGGINESGEVVGTSAASGNREDAFLYTSTGGMVDLNTLYSSLLVTGGGSQVGFTQLAYANAINDSGEIVGTGDYWNGTTYESNQAFLLITAPEPGAWTLMLVEVGLLLLFRLRKFCNCPMNLSEMSGANVRNPCLDL
jgi:probable HAF family extracellular repeat protein